MLVETLLLALVVVLDLQIVILQAVAAVLVVAAARSAFAGWSGGNRSGGRYRSVSRRSRGYSGCRGD